MLPGRQFWSLRPLRNAWLVQAAVLLLLATSGALAAASSLPPPSLSPCSVSARFAGLNVRVDAWGDDSARVRIAPTPLIDAPSPQALTASPPPSSSASACAPLEDASTSSATVSPLSVTYGNLRVNVTEDGFVTVSRVSPPLVLLSTTALSFTPYAWSSTFYKPTYPAYWSVNWTYSQPAGYTHGLGEHHHGREQLPYVDYSIPFTFAETAGLKGDVSIPWTLHSEGAATLWNQPGWGSYTISKGTVVTWAAVQAPQFDALVAVAPANWTRAQDRTPYEPLLQRLLTATASYPRPLPHYASGFWQCKLRYRSQQETIDAAMGYVNRSLPLSVIVIDAGNWAQLGDFAFNPQCFPDPSAMVRQLRAHGIEVMVSLWPHAGALSANFPYLKSHDMLTHNASGQFLNESIPWMPWPPGPQPEASAVDFIAPAAQAYVSALLQRNYVQHGIKMFWLDADEPDCAYPGQQWWNNRPDVEIESVYPMGVINTVKMALEASNVTDGMMLSRDTWIGGAPMGAAVWSGDIVSEFAELRRQVLVSQNVALSGIYHWTTDVGGFINGVLGNATFEELAVRWFQFGAFCPIFRTHGDRWPGLPDDACGSTGGHTEVWYFQNAPIIESLLRLREAMRPYVEFHLQRAAVTGRPLLQPMFYSFADPQLYQAAAEEQFTFGPEFVVAPVLEEKAQTRRLFLPRIGQQAAGRLAESRRAVGMVREVRDGSAVSEEEDGRRYYEVVRDEEVERLMAPEALTWRHFYSGAEYSGGQWVTVDTSIADFPLFQLSNKSQAAIPAPLSPRGRPRPATKTEAE